MRTCRRAQLLGQSCAARHVGSKSPRLPRVSPDGSTPGPRRKHCSRRPTPSWSSKPRARPVCHRLVFLLGDDTKAPHRACPPTTTNPSRRPRAGRSADGRERFQGHQFGRVRSHRHSPIGDIHDTFARNRSVAYRSPALPEVEWLCPPGLHALVFPVLLLDLHLDRPRAFCEHLNDLGVPYSTGSFRREVTRWAGA